MELRCRLAKYSFFLFDYNVNEGRSAKKTRGKKKDAEFWESGVGHLIPVLFHHPEKKNTQRTQQPS